MQVCKYEDGASMSQIILIRYLTQEHYWFLFQIFLVSVVCVFYQFVAKTLKICKFLIGTFRPKMGLLPEKIQVAKFFLNHLFFSFFFFYVCSLVPVPSGSIATLPKSILPWDFQLAVINRDRIHSWRREPPRSVAQCCSCNKIGRMTYVAPSSTRNPPSRYRWHVSINYGIASDP